MRRFFCSLQKHIPESCDHNFKAGSEKRGNFHNMDQTGVMSMVCRHCITLRVANMKRGETYRLVAFFHLLAHRLNILFFCYDVVCRYWSFAKKVSDLGKLGKLKLELNEMIATMVDKTLPFLSRFHGQAHAWFCQVNTLGALLKRLFSFLITFHQSFRRFCGLATFRSLPRPALGRNRNNTLPSCLAIVQ